MTAQYSAVGQPDTTKIDALVNQLSWKSISMNCIATMLMLTHEDSTEKALVNIGKPATDKLIKALPDKNKTAIAHIILTQIWGDNIGKNYFSTKYIYKDCNQLIGWHYTYNGLVWEWYSGKGDSIRQVEIDKIENYWTRKIIEKQNVSMDYAKISADLESVDNLAYPCNKIYENNSAGVKYETLHQLLGKKSTDTLFKTLWNKFGNDSTMSSFNDCFLITYGPEGLSFRFERDSVLSIIFVEDSYKGELPFKLKIVDRKKTIEKKLGLPNKEEKFQENSWSYYTDKNLSYYFDKTGKVLQFYISKK